MSEAAVFYPKGHEMHFERGHPERPERIEAIKKALIDAGIWEQFRQMQPKELSDAQLESVHTPAYLARLQESSLRGLHLDMDTYTTRQSWCLAKNAAGGAVAVARAVWRGDVGRGLALTRPPGHHATAGQGMGFCLLNNIALAAQDLLSGGVQVPAPASRLAIIDLDLHHGNGTQDIFWRRKDVFYFSTHQYPHYPGSGRLDENGAGDGEGYTANFPLPPFSGDRAFEAIMHELILPLLDGYMPQMLLVSFGFDTHWLDPLGQLQLSAGGYGKLIDSLVEWADGNCQGRIALFLEGGYHLDAGAACAQSVASALLGSPWQDPLGPAPRPESDGWMVNFKRAKQIWQV